jgi:archaellin
MRVWFIFGIVVLILAVISGCGDESDFVPPENVSEEVNESVVENVTVEENVSEEEATDGIDLELVSLTASTRYPNPDEEFELKIKVENNGNNDVDGFEYTVTILKDGVDYEKDTYTYEETLEANDDVKIRKDMEFSTYDEYEIQVYLDRDNEIKESNEFNNFETIEINIIEHSEEEEEEEEEEVIPINIGECSDSDGGKTYNVLGNCTDEGSAVASPEDFCIDDHTLMEFYCVNVTGKCELDEERCDHGCEEGACKSG